MCELVRVRTPATVINRIGEDSYAAHRALTTNKVANRIVSPHQPPHRRDRSTAKSKTASNS